ncbi:MAG: mannose-1-phosphate guanylyltransferase [Bryobacterales bacterium]|nr:mannose-1-phosphate guanylyltransferase [Bryobacterales bacterium]
MKTPLYAVILAGGRGTRFWPRSRKAHPKQVLSIVGERTLLQQTVERISKLIPPDHIYVVTSESLRAEVLRQIPDVPAEQVLAEPLPRNSAPAIALGTHLIRLRDEKAIVGVFPADHVVTKPAKFLATVKHAFRTAGQDNLVVVGIQPRWAETGYGYLEFPKDVVPGESSAYPIHSFREKPDRPTAARYLKAGRYFWNSGMFFWKASAFLEAFNRYLPKTALQIASIGALGSKTFERDLAEFFPLCESISVDYAVMEKARNVVGVAAADFGWNDVGSWQAVYELSEKDADANALRGGADLLAVESKGNYVDAGGKLVALVGVEDLVIVDTGDALLVTRREEAHRVNDMVKLLEKKGLAELL